MGAYKHYFGQLDANDQTKATFYLAVTCIRHLQFEQARSLLLTLVELRKKHRSSAPIKGWVNLGFGVFHYCYGRLLPAERYATQALASAAVGSDHFFRFLTLDLLGHCEINRGEVQKGLQRHHEALQVATTLGRGAMHQTSIATSTLYRSNLGLLSHAFKTLKTLHSKLHFKDSFMAAQIELEMARLSMHEGKSRQARAILDQSRKECFSRGNKRLQTLHHLRLAQLFFQRAEHPEAEEVCVEALKHIRMGEGQAPDIRLETSLLGMLQKLGSRLAEPTKLHTLTRWQNSLLASRILNRERGLPLTPLPVRNEDPLGDLLDGLFAKRPESIAQCIDQGKWGLLHKAFPVGSGKNSIVLGLEPQSITLTIKGEAFHGHLTALQWKLIQAIIEGPQTTSQLAKKVWGENYHPHRHEKLAHALLSRFHRLSDFFRQVLHQDQEGICLLGPIEVHQAPSHPIGKALGPQIHLGLSIRQNSLLSLKPSVFDVVEYSRRFQISDRTAQRDLADLANRGLIKVLGKGKTTRYAYLVTLGETQ